MYDWQCKREGKRQALICRLDVARREARLCYYQIYFKLRFSLSGVHEIVTRLDTPGHGTRITAVYEVLAARSRYETLVQ